MAITQLTEIMQHLRRAALLREGAGLTDAELLEGFISRREDAALAALVQRHGPMVWGVCRRVLRNYHDAEDAFQATFLVLVRKAASVVPREMLVNWLHGVAHQTALKAKATAARRNARERQTINMPEPDVLEPGRGNDLRLLIDKELRGLPEKYRVVILLCDLEGKTRREAARQLGVPDGTVAGRLARARVMLAKRLARQGSVLSAGAVAAALSCNAASASVPSSLLMSTIKAATLVAANHAAAGVVSASVAALAGRVLRAMSLTKLKSVVALLLALAIVGTGTVAHRTFAGTQEAGVQEARTQEPGAQPAQGELAKGELAKGEPAKGAAQKTDKERIVGTWRVTKATTDGKDLDRDFSSSLIRFIFANDGKMILTLVDDVKKGDYNLVGVGKVDLAIGMKDQGVLPAIYKFDGNDRLTLCGSSDAKERPTDFRSELGDGRMIYQLARCKLGEEKPTPEEIEKYKKQVLDEPATEPGANQIDDHAESANSLKQIGFAFHNYHAQHKTFPAHAIYSKDGKTPLLSWRVALLPYLNHKDLYAQFKLDEPWDSEHNRKLIPKMPRSYADPAEKPNNGRTRYQVVTGPGTLFDGAKGMAIRDITDCTSNTLLALETKDSVVWTKPADLTLPKDKDKKPPIGERFPDGFNVLLCDGSVRLVPHTMPVAKLRAFVTPAAGD
ncbi:MAG: sigma-70 family RNA polymerase sigma factor [Planctomycetes bacterium]|nr:sigma-70 family RNA polymerase sigma factor [Planctomycetota bacterium]